MSSKGEFLVAIMNNLSDFDLARNQHWYRIPVESVTKFLSGRWPPEHLAFYQTKVFGSEAFAIHYSARVTDIKQVTRQQLFPGLEAGPNATKRYYQLVISSLERLAMPILSRRFRRIVFIPTTIAKFEKAVEINDLYDDSPLEDKLWAAMKLKNIPAERQEHVRIGAKNYFLDFAIYCAKGQIDVEVDGDTWHDAPEQVKADKKRSNELTANGWQTLRFTTHDVREKSETYCAETIIETVDLLGGLEEPGKFMPRKLGAEYVYQPSLFEPKAAYLVEEDEADSDALWKEIEDLENSENRGEAP